MSDEAITIDDFFKADLRAGTVVSAEAHPNADRLLVLKVDIGEEEPRTVVFGGAAFFVPQDLVGQQVVVVANLSPAKLRGVESFGMCLASKFPVPDEDGEMSDVLRLVTVDAPPGTRIS